LTVHVDRPRPIWLEPWPQAGLEDLGACPVCGGGERTLFLDDLVDDVFHAARGRWTSHRCATCTNVYLDPRPNAETIGDAYATYYTHETSVDASSQGRSSFLRKIYKGAGTLYVQGRFHRSSLFARSLSAMIGGLLFPLAARESFKHRWLPRARPGARLLDIGCGNGKFLSVARQDGWSVSGIDLDERALAVARAAGHSVQQGTVADLSAEHFGAYDAVTISHVIEHVPDPLADIRQAFRLLRPGGFLYLETPNIDALGAQEFGARWRGMEAPRHFILFTRSGLQALIARAGFERISFKRRLLYGNLYTNSAEIERNYLALTGGSNQRVFTHKQRLRGWLAPSARLEFLTLTARRPG